ncbi:MAG: gamma-glutamylcyclotransferase [Ilumatobacteraceae bacterium]|nr:gamma-glutamylcyclotransferase [Ilumatobacteraceae bacterium]
MTAPHRSDTWVFGYGSLVSPTSIARTIGREPQAATDLRVGHLDGYGRRWNYGSHGPPGNWRHEEVEVNNGLVIALGLTVAASETCNGVAIRVTADELANLDQRERHYERTDVTDLIRYEDLPATGQVVTYVPRPSAIQRYEQGRDAGRAAIERRYWDLVNGAFSGLSPEHHDQFLTTPAPDVPVTDISFS